MELLYLLFIVLGLDRIPAEHVLRALDQALLPVLNLIGMNIELLGQLSQGALALQGSQCHLRLEGRCFSLEIPRFLRVIFCSDWNCRRFHLSRPDPCPTDGVQLYQPGVMAKVNAIFSERGINIAGEYLQTDDQIGYVVVDFDIDEGFDTQRLERLKAIDGTLRARIVAR